jgi:RNA polymerase sigma factor (TIGR02999 family)
MQERTLADALEGESAWAGASQEATELFAEHYAELTRLAHSRLYAANLKTPPSTQSLLHESYMKLAAGEHARSFGTRAQFFAYASHTMRTIIVDWVRANQAERRGGGASVIPLDTDVAGIAAADASIEEVHEALLALEHIEPSLAKLVELRYFAGMTEGEVAQALDVSERTVRREWVKARASLLVLLETR